MQASLEGPPRTKGNQCLTDNTQRDTREQNYLPTGRLNQNSGSSSSDLCLRALWVNSSKLLRFSELLVSLGVHRLQGFSGCCDSDGGSEGGGNGGGVSAVRS